MQEEIFGPIIPVLIYEKLDEAIEFINNREKPLALYIFSKSKSNTDKMLRGTSSGGVVINHGLLNFSNSNLPFGGVNHSGIGKAHGKHSFIEFSNEKAVVSQWSPISVSTFLRQPFTHGTKRLIDLLMKWV
jgi:aldehyde dehydrogenase (NAD+)